MSMSRRAFLILTAGLTASLPGLTVGPAWGAPLDPSRPRPAEPLERFLELSRELTGFVQLDPALGREYWLALSDWEPALVRLLSGQEVSPQERGTVSELVIESWYTGTVPTPQGTRTVTYEGALAWACMARQRPVTCCLK